MAQPGLSDVSIDLFECIADNLDFQDICNLRCVSREICYKNSQRKFQSHFRTKRVRLTLDGLRDFVWATSEGRFGRLVKDLTLVGTVYDRESVKRSLEASSRRSAPDKRRASQRMKMILSARQTSTTVLSRKRRGSPESPKDLDLIDQNVEEWQSALKQGILLDRLQTAFRQIKEISSGLDKLSLKIEVACAPFKTMPRLQMTGLDKSIRADAFALSADMGVLALSALRQSNIEVRTLDLFTADSTSVCCSLPTDVLGNAFLDGIDDYMPALSGLRSLTICIRDPDAATAAQSLDELEQVFALHIKHRGFVKLLRLCANVEELSISRFRPSPRRQVTGMWESRHSVHLEDVHQLAESAKFPSLRTIYLGGIPVNISDLTTFIDNHRITLESIYLHNLGIEQGPLSTLLQQLTLDKYQKLNSLGLEHMNETRDGRPKLILFDQTQASGLTEISGAYHNQDIIVRRGADLRLPITYFYSTGWVQGSFAIAQDGRRRLTLFGERF